MSEENDDPQEDALPSRENIKASTMNAATRPKHPPSEQPPELRWVATGPPGGATGAAERRENERPKLMPARNGQKLLPEPPPIDGRGAGPLCPKPPKPPPKLRPPPKLLPPPPPEKPPNDLPPPEKPPLRPPPDLPPPDLPTASSLHQLNVAAVYPNIKRAPYETGPWHCNRLSTARCRAKHSTSRYESKISRDRPCRNCRAERTDRQRERAREPVQAREPVRARAARERNPQAQTKADRTGRNSEHRP